MSRCEIIAVGTEILLGDILNMNVKYISKKLADLGLDLYQQTAVGDNLTRLCDTINSSIETSDIIITLGGLGPTHDFITKEAVCKVLGIDLVFDNSVFNEIDKVMPECSIKQSYIPQNSIVVKNDYGTASGIIIEKDEKTIILLPGSSSELISMFENKIYEYLQSKSDYIIKSKTLKIIGIGESNLEEKLNDIFSKQSNPTVDSYTKDGEVHLKITVKTTSHEIADNLIYSIESQIKEIMGDNIYGTDDDILEGFIINNLKKKNLTLSIAESCTGGMLCAKLTEVSGASEVIIGGVVSYSNESKIRLLDVKESTLIKDGAVSESTAKEMAKGIKSILNSDIGISITGIAGPGGGSEEKPVGLVYIGICIGNDGANAYKYNFVGNRNKIRNESCNKALDLIRVILENK